MLLQIFVVFGMETTPVVLFEKTIVSMTGIFSEGQNFAIYDQNLTIFDQNLHFSGVLAYNFEMLLSIFLIFCMWHGSRSSLGLGDSRA